MKFSKIKLAFLLPYFGIILFVPIDCSWIIYGTGSYLSNKETPIWVYPKTSSFYKDIKFYVVDVNQMSKENGNKSYLGSDSTYHYFRAWHKFIRDNEVSFFALKYNLCDVRPIRTIDDESNYLQANYTYHLWRRAVIDNNKCYVEGDNFTLERAKMQSQSYDKSK